MGRKFSQFIYMLNLSLIIIIAGFLVIASVKKYRGDQNYMSINISKISFLVSKVTRKNKAPIFEGTDRNKIIEIGGPKVRILGISLPKNKKLRSVIVERLGTGDIRSYRVGEKVFGGATISAISDGQVEFRFESYVSTIALNGANPTRLDLNGISETFSF